MLRAEDAAPQLRNDNLTSALRRARSRGGKPGVAVNREGILDSLAPVVNVMTAAQIKRGWKVSFAGEAGIDVGGVHIDMITEACLDFEKRCVEQDSVASHVQSA